MHKFLGHGYQLAYRIPGVSGHHTVIPATSFNNLPDARVYRDQFAKFYLDNNPMTANASEVERLKAIDFFLEQTVAFGGEEDDYYPGYGDCNKDYLCPPSED